MTDYPVAVRDVSPSTVGGGRVIDVKARFIDEDKPRTPPEKDFGKRVGDRQNISYVKAYADKGTPERTRHSKAESKFKKGAKAVSEAASTVARKSAPIVEKAASTVARKSAPIVKKAAVTSGRLAKQGLEETFDVDIASDDRGYTVKRRKHKRRVVKKRVVKKKVVKKVVKRRKTSPRSGTSPRRKTASRSATPKKVVKKAAPKKKRSSQVDKWADSDWFI